MIIQHVALNTVSCGENGFNGECSKDIKGVATLGGACFAKLGCVCFANQDCTIAVQWQQRTRRGCRAFVEFTLRINFLTRPSRVSAV